MTTPDQPIHTPNTVEPSVPIDRDEDLAKLAQEIENTLAHFTGGDEKFYQEIFKSIVYTAGVRYLLNAAQCHWLLGEIWAASHTTPAIQADPITFWNLTVHEDRSATLTADHDTDGPRYYTKEIPYTDFPLTHIKLFLDKGCLMLPREY